MEILYGSDNRLSLVGLKNASTGVFINNATVTCTLINKSGNQLTGQSWPLSMGYVGASNGDYAGVLSASLVLVAGDIILAQVTADAGAGLKRYWQVPLTVRIGAE